MKEQISIPKNIQDSDSINLVNKNTFAYYTTYEATIREVLIYSLYLLDKHKKDLTIPIKDTYIQDLFSLDLKKTTDIMLQTSDIYHPEILDYIIFWEDKDNYYISPNLFKLINKSIEKNKKKNIFLYLSIGSPDTMLHANIIYIDISQKTIERFDPYGNIEQDFSLNLDDIFKKEFSRINNFKYIGSSFMGVTAFQTISRETDIHRKKIGDLGGFCLAWCMWYIELRLKNSDLDPNSLVNKTIKKMIKENIDFIDFIRNYANNLDKYLRNFLKKSGIKKKNIYNKIHTNKEYALIKDKIYQEFKKI